ncbi:hypothetical protein [Helicobacter winghamensis]|uniref:Uncharacterized protein n=1 Tax=Helicobacter winghamensis TaxID=157268 RepID=A0A2N3PK29_9HELI|nr:hypothetical protein [Helicobacter winghamensis]PKT77956.1 hypothetical protein BCM32_04970 [Helicobacter winghamensis]PKT81754.1 hypothetical protein BCM31_06405 [Helicobacter winghamensis]PKT81766.1 hypothetical protein BCM33_07010 [Helicobacter winghamensis]
MNFSNLFSVFLKQSSLVVALGLLSGVLYFHNQSLKNENAILKLKELHTKSELEGLELKLQEQNKAILKVRLDLKEKNETLAEVSKVQKVFLKDTSCESKLKAYKELFNILGTKNENL